MLNGLMWIWFYYALSAHLSLATLFMSLFAFNHPATKSARHNNFVTTTTTTTIEEGKQTDPTKKMAESRPKERGREWESEGNPGTLCGASVENYGPELAQHMKCNSLFFALITREWRCVCRIVCCAVSWCGVWVRLI